MKKTVLGLMLLVLLTSVGFARGVADDDDDDRYRDWDYGESEYYGQRNGRAWQNSPELRTNTESFTGTFQMEDEQYFVLETDDGERYYLIVDVPISLDLVPEDGAELKVEAFRSDIAPNNLVVVEAEVNGTAIDLDWREARGWKGGYPRNGYGCFDDDDFDRDYGRGRYHRSSRRY